MKEFLEKIANILKTIYYFLRIMLILIQIYTLFTYCTNFKIKNLFNSVNI